jgi:hypothetical protein
VVVVKEEKEEEKEEEEEGAMFLYPFHGCQRYTHSSRPPCDKASCINAGILMQLRGFWSE